MEHFAGYGIFALIVLFGVALLVIPGLDGIKSIMRRDWKDK